MRRRGGSYRARYAVIAGSLIASSVYAVGAVATSPPSSATVTPPGSSANVQVGQLTLSSQQPSPFGIASGGGNPAANFGSKNPPKHGKPGGKSPIPVGNNSAIPNVSCQPASAACDAIGPTNGGASTNPHALDAAQNRSVFGSPSEPPDQGLCAGAGYVMELTNSADVQVFNPSLQPASNAETLDTLMGLTQLGWSSGGDPICQYDPDNGGHWFVSQVLSTNTEASGGPFTGCFVGVLDSCRQGIAVSTTNNPLTSAWNIYFLDPNQVSANNPGAGHLLNDYAKVGNTAAALLLFYDEFNLNPSLPACPSYGCLGFNGSQEFALQKSALESGAATVNLVHENMGTDPSIQPPEGSCFNGPTAGVTCWYQNIPANSPTDSEFDTAFGGTGFMVGSLDFVGQGDNRVAAFYWTELSNLDSAGCAGCSNITFGDQLFTGVQQYSNEGAECLASRGGPCSLGGQRSGTLDLGTYCKKFAGSPTPKCPENGIATNGDGATQASYSGGQLWFAISTLVNEGFATGNEIHDGGAYWVVGTSSFTGANPQFTLTSQGYVAAAHEDIEFPTLVGGTGAAGALMSFSLSGNGGPTGADHGGYFPSSAYGLVSTTSTGLVDGTLHVTALGQAAYDGDTEYQPLPVIPRPRWGDYGGAVFVPGQGFYFASEYVPYPACDPTFWLKVDQSCGGTRDQLANWGTSISSVG